jgi:hypothetical protein
MRKMTSSLYLLFVVLFSFYISGCFLKYYKVTKPPEATAAAEIAAKSSTRYFILHQGGEYFRASNIKVDQQNKLITLKVEQLDLAHASYINKPEKRTYKKSNENIITEIHLYSNDSTKHSFGDTFSLPLSKLMKVEILEKNKGATTANHVFSVLGITAGVVGLIYAIVLATKSSCPFVSGYDGTTFKLQGEIYGGAIYPSLQRDDYLPLDLQPVNGLLQVKISNELQEKQHTDLAELWVIEHDASIKVLPDEHGNLYSVNAEANPIKAVASNKDVSDQLLAHDDKYYNFSSKQRNGVNELELSFNKPAEANNAKLVLQLKNSYWLDYVYGELVKHLGGYFNTWSKQQQSKTADELTKWKNEQALPLMVEVKTSSGWKQVASLTTIGPVAYREIVVPLELKDVETKHLEVRLSTGFMFWEIDKASIDYSANKDYKITKLHPVSAIDELQNDVRQSLMKTDKLFLEQPVPGNVATINYNAPIAKEGNRMTYILHANGYYEHVRDFTGKPNVKFLKGFKEPQALSTYSMQKYQQLNVGKLN